MAEEPLLLEREKNFARCFLTTATGLVCVHFPIDAFLIFPINAFLLVSYILHNHKIPVTTPGDYIRRIITFMQGTTYSPITY